MVNERKVIENIKRHLLNGDKIDNVIRYVNVESLKEQHRKQPQGKARGIDGISKEEYAMNLEDNLMKLVDSMKTFSYKPKPVKRVFIPKDNGKYRPLGMPSYEDRLVQGCMTDVLNAVYEPKFLDCSYGFRQNKSCHQALKEIVDCVMARKVNYVIEADIKCFFDNINHDILMKFLENDIKDKAFLRYIKRFLISGYMENVKYYDTDKGTPQGGLISPILANVYLHYVLDLWFKEEIVPRLKGKAYLVRFADDFIIMCQYENEARKVYDVLFKRFAKFKLELEESKTKILPFGRFKGNDETFDFLGFTHFNMKGRNGKYTVGHRITKKKKRQKKDNIKKFLKEHMHDDLEKVVNMLNKKLVGMYNYYGINGMLGELYKIYNYLMRMGYIILRRRSQRNNINWSAYKKIITEVYPIEVPKIKVNIWNYSV